MNSALNNVVEGSTQNILANESPKSRTSSVDCNDEIVNFQDEIDQNLKLESESDPATFSEDVKLAIEDEKEIEENEMVSDYSGGCFEGPEKTLEVVFRNGRGHTDGLRAMSRDQLDALCTQARCTILSSISSRYMDAYVLSESSLFVYKHRYIMKTCGTTTLLRCLSLLLEYADNLGLEVTWVGYSRKNLNFPSAQLFPHSNFSEEVNYIDRFQERLRGSGMVLGPVTGDHWFVYVADLFPTEESTMFGSLMGCRDETGEALRISPKSSVKGSPPSSNRGSPPTTVRVSPPAVPSAIDFDAHLEGLPSRLYTPIMDAPYSCGKNSTERTINMMMFDMAPDIASVFYKSNSPTAKIMTAKAGIQNLCVGATIDDAAFTPCGYSMNAILHDAYYTIHITPEPQCSYASFETNTCLKSYAAMVRNVLGVFRPKRFVLTMFGDEDGFDAMTEVPCSQKRIVMPNLSSKNMYSYSYVRTSQSFSKVESGFNCMMACYSLVIDKVTALHPGGASASQKMSDSADCNSGHASDCDIANVCSSNSSCAGDSESGDFNALPVPPSAPSSGSPKATLTRVRSYSCL